MPDGFVFAALLTIPSLFAYALLRIGRWLGGMIGMRIGAALAVVLVSVPMFTVVVIYLRLISQRVSLVPKYGDQLLGLVLSGLIGIGTLAAFITLRIAWNRQSKALATSVEPLGGGPARR